jgi:hypothetical protein
MTSAFVPVNEHSLAQIRNSQSMQGLSSRVTNFSSSRSRSSSPCESKSFCPTTPRPQYFSSKASSRRETSSMEWTNHADPQSAPAMPRKVSWCSMDDTSERSTSHRAEQTDNEWHDDLLVSSCPLLPDLEESPISFRKPILMRKTRTQSAWRNIEADVLTEMPLYK